MSLERCCIMVVCRRKRLASECLLHRWCNTLGFWGLRDVTGEMLHHGGMLKEGLVRICGIRVNVATNSYKPCQWDRAQFWGGRIVMVASRVTVATVLQQTMHKRRGREGDYNSRKCCIRTTASPGYVPFWNKVRNILDPVLHDLVLDLIPDTDKYAL